MSRYIAIALLGTSLAGLPLLTGCDKDKETKSVDVKTTAPDGTKTVDKENSSTDSKSGDTKTTIEHKVTGSPSTNP